MCDFNAMDVRRWGFCIQSHLLPVRMVRSSAGTLAGALRWRCPKTPTSAYAWWSRDAPVRSGWYETGSSIPGTEAGSLKRFGQPSSSLLDHEYWTGNRRQTGVASVWCFILQTALICPRAAGLSSTGPLRSIRSISTVFRRAVRWRGPYGAPRCLKRPAFSKKKKN